MPAEKRRRCSAVGVCSKSAVASTGACERQVAARAYEIGCNGSGLHSPQVLLHIACVKFQRGSELRQVYIPIYG